MGATQTSIDGWMDKQSGKSIKWTIIQAGKEWDSNILKKEGDSNLEDIMLSEIRESQKDNYCVIPLIWSPKSSQTHRDRM